MILFHFSSSSDNATIIIRLLVVVSLLLLLQLGPQAAVEAREVVVISSSITEAGTKTDTATSSSLSSTPPSNDDICNAQLIVVDSDFPSVAIPYSNVMATTEENEIIHPGIIAGSEYDDDSAIQSTVWFKFVSFDSGYMDISIDHHSVDDNMQLALWKLVDGDNNYEAIGDCSSSAVAKDWSVFELIAASSDDDDGVYYPLITNAIVDSGEIYYIQLGGYAGETSTGYLLIDFFSIDDDGSTNIVQPPVSLPDIIVDTPTNNDDICNAHYIESIPSIIEFDSTFATAQPNEIHPGDSPSGSCYEQDGWCFGDEIQASIWYKFWIIDDGGTINIMLDTTAGDMQLALWKFITIDSNYVCDNDWSLFELVAANEDSEAGNFMPMIQQAQVVANTLYYIQIDGFLGDTSYGNMTIEFINPTSTGTNGGDEDEDEDYDSRPPPSHPSSSSSSPGGGINPFIHDNICNAYDVSIPSVTKYGCYHDDNGGDDDDASNNGGYLATDNNSDADDTTNTGSASWWLCSNNDYFYYDFDDDESLQMLIWFTFVVTTHNSGNSIIDINLIDDISTTTGVGNIFKLTLWKYTGATSEDGFRLEACTPNQEEEDESSDTIDFNWSTDMDVVAVNSRNGAHGFHPYIHNVIIEPNQRYYLKLDGGLYHHDSATLSRGGKIEVKYSSGGSSSGSSTTDSIDGINKPMIPSSIDFDGGDSDDDDDMTGGSSGGIDESGSDDIMRGGFGATMIFYSLVAATFLQCFSMMIVM